jgi:hypothetical protein
MGFLCFFALFSPFFSYADRYTDRRKRAPVQIARRDARSEA